MKAGKNTTIDGSLLAAGRNGYGSYGGGGAGGSVWIQTWDFFGAGTIDVKGGSNGGTAGQYEVNSLAQSVTKYHRIYSLLVQF